MPPAAPSASIGDLVWFDADGDGVQDAGEPGVEGVAVRLLDASGHVAAEDVTDAGGVYALTPSTSGPFTVEVVVPDGHQPTLVDVGADDAIDSDANPAEVEVGPVETTVRVAVGDSAGQGDLDVGLIAISEDPPAPDTTAVPTTTESPAVETTTTTAVPTTSQPTTTAVPTTEPPPTTTATPETTQPTTVAPTAAPTTTVAPTTIPAG